LTEEERTALEEFNGDPETLGSAEQFYIELLHVPRLEQKINFFLFKKQFEDQIEALRESAEIITSACEELLNSVQFAKILKWIFTIGSCLNRDTRLSESAGFSLESLPKIIETKAGQGNLTFIDFLVMKVVSKNPELLHFEEELPHLELASKLSLEILSNHKKETENEINELRKEITLYETSPPHTFSQEDKFLNVMKPFLEYAQKTFESVSNVLNNAITTFRTVVEYFGDDSKSSTLVCFFQNIVIFAHAFHRSHHAIIERQRRAELAKAKETKRQDTPRWKLESPLKISQQPSQSSLISEKCILSDSSPICKSTDRTKNRGLESVLSEESTGYKSIEEEDDFKSQDSQSESEEKKEGLESKTTEMQE